MTKESVINYDVGVDQLAKPGDPVKAGSTLVRIHAANRAQATAARTRLQTAFAVSAKPPRTLPLFSEVILNTHDVEHVYRTKMIDRAPKPRRSQLTKKLWNHP